MENSLLHASPLPQLKVPVPARGNLLHIFGALIFIYGDLVFVATTQGVIFDHLVLEAKKGFCFWVQWNYNNRKYSSWQTTTPRVLQVADVNTTPVF